MRYGFKHGLYATKVRDPQGLGRAHWKLLAPLEYHSALIGPLIVPTGFLTDYASVPRLPLSFALFGDTAHASATIHDYLCRNHHPQRRISWKLASSVFLEAMKHEGVPAWRRWPMYLAVRWFGNPHLKKVEL